MLSVGTIRIGVLLWTKNSMSLSSMTKMSKILVVDDMQAELELICQQLTKAGHTILTAANGEEALHQARANQPDAIVTDWMMPVMGGLELCRHLNDRLVTDDLLVCG